MSRKTGGDRAVALPFMRRGGIPFAIAILMLLAGPASGDELADAGRKILETHQKAVVTVKLVVKQTTSMTGMPTNQSESTNEVTGTVVDASGLIVLSLTEMDPSSYYSSMMSDMGEQYEGFKMESEFTDIKILRDDGTEIAAHVVLRDKDQDLAFVRPKEKLAKPLEWVDFSQSASPKVLDPVIALNRLGKLSGRAYSASIERIEAVVSRPRTFFIPGGQSSSSGLGSPAFTLDGKVVGIAAMRMVTGGKGAGSSMMSSRWDDMGMAIFIPAEDILETAKQAPMTPEETPEPEEEAKDVGSATP